jgi:hypothetical protein
VGSKTPGTGDGIAATPAGAVGSVPSSVSVEGFVGTDEGKTGTPGGDCAPGTPGKENISLTVGNFAAVPGYTAFSASAKSAPPSGTATAGADVRMPAVDSTAFVTGAAGIVPRTG